MAVPAFLALAQTGGEAPDFCTIGTGSGLDALAAIEILKARNVVILDLHEDVVRQAHRNIQDNVITDSQVTLLSAAGDLLTSGRPRESRARFDLRKPTQHPARHR